MAESSATTTVTDFTTAILWEGWSLPTSPHLRRSQSVPSAKCTSFGGLKMRKNKITILSGSLGKFEQRVRRNAAKIDQGEPITPGITIMFEDPMDMLSVLTSERVRLLRQAKAGATSITALASELERDLRAVSRDVARLEEAGLLRTSYRTNPGHGRFKIVEPVAREFVLTASI